jgi:hypothetical protein
MEPPSWPLAFTVAEAALMSLSATAAVPVAATGAKISARPIPASSIAGNTPVM